LDLIQYHQLFQGPQHEVRISQTRLIVRGLEIEVVHGSWPSRCRVSGEGGFTHLPRP
jgi:hypothetical protein